MLRKVFMVIVGPLPPPYGGVSISVGNYYISLKNEGIDVVGFGELCAGGCDVL